MRKSLKLFGTIDTKKYRYRLVENDVLRIELDKLGTTEAIDGWKKVGVIND